MIISNLLKEDYYKSGNYNLLNKFTGEMYSGSGILKDCLNRHQSGYNNDNHINKNLREAFKRTPSGWEFIYIVVDEPDLTKEENRQIAFNLEQEDINNFYGHPNFLNIAKDARAGGGTISSWWNSLSEEEKIKHNNNNSERLLLYHKNNPSAAKNHSENMKNYYKNDPNAKEILKQAALKQHSQPGYQELNRQNTIDYFSDVNNKIKHSEIMKKWSENNKQSDKTRELRSISLKGNKNGLGHKLTVEQIEQIRQRKMKPIMGDNIKYSSQREAAEKLGISYQAIQGRINSSNFQNWFTIAT